MVQMRPRMRRWLPSTMSWDPMFSRWTLCSFRNCRALSTFSKQWIRIRPLVGFGWMSGTEEKESKHRKLQRQAGTTRDREGCRTEYKKGEKSIKMSGLTFSPAVHPTAPPAV